MKRLITYTVGTSSYRHAAEIEAKLQNNPAVRKDFQKAKGDTEFTSFLFGNPAECLDIFHALENISKFGKVLYKDAEEFQEWFETMRLVLLQDDFRHYRNLVSNKQHG
ncbi:MAG: hypothetical protein LBN39_11455 [Planctomycetaceae bacterium]|nr:hypothetical protein [Planctomycetaceae bacterium]